MTAQFTASVASSAANDPIEDGHILATVKGGKLCAAIDGHGGAGAKNFIVDRAEQLFTRAFTGKATPLDALKKVCGRECCPAQPSPGRGFVSE